MGLDQYMYQFTRVPEDYINKFKNPIDWDTRCKFEETTNITFYPRKHIEKSELDIFKHLFVPVTIENEYWNLEKALKDKYGDDLSTENLYEVSESINDGIISYRFKNKNTNENYLIEFDKDNENKYIVKEFEEQFAICKEEIAYWRKNYVLRQYMSKTWNYSGNLVYKHFNYEDIQQMIDDLKRYHKLDSKKEILENIEDAIDQLQNIVTNKLNNSYICYLEWF